MGWDQPLAAKPKCETKHCQHPGKEQAGPLTVVLDAVGKDQVHIIQEDFSVLIFVFGNILEQMNQRSDERRNLKRNHLFL